MHTCIPSHKFKRSWCSCSGWVNAGSKNTPSMHHPRRWNVTTPMVGIESSHRCKSLTQNGEPQISSWGTQKKKTCKFMQCCSPVYGNRPDTKTLPSLVNISSCSLVSKNMNNNDLYFYSMIIWLPDFNQETDILVFQESSINLEENKQITKQKMLQNKKRSTK